MQNFELVYIRLISSCNLGCGSYQIVLDTIGNLATEALVENSLGFDAANPQSPQPALDVQFLGELSYPALLLFGCLDLA